MTDSSKMDAVLTYQLKFDEKTEFVYEFVNEKSLQLRQPVNAPQEDWMKLSHCQCENCPLTEETHPECPVARNIYVLLKDWSQIISHDKVGLTVTSEQRTVIAQTTAQKALSSLLGLIMATSDCPHTRFFRPMANFHLPLSSASETNFRVLSSFFLMQYFQSMDVDDFSFDLQKLNEIYENMHIVNVHIKNRLESAVIEDAALNAVVILDMFAISMPYYIEDELQKLRLLFSGDKK